MSAPDWIAVAHTRVVCDIGQLTTTDRRRLDAEVRRGALAKWRGYWFPVAGASYGIGPLKTCYGPARLPDAAK